ncbi:YndJ family protein [Pseudalkalibacillus sp. SCS-8]|uniref:YndJ family protein n=1 Tax=Pseudalkalibacillus nanhaiensis TaxID=3115291 RepID=UPI0032DB7DFA
MKRRINFMTLPGIFLFIASSLFSVNEPFYLMLTAAQLVFVPMILQLLVEVKTKHIVATWTAMASIFLLHIGLPMNAQILFGFIYLMFTLFVALYGVKRFFMRGFTNWAEISIDIGMMFLFVGGLWFFAYVAQINTGFSPLLTWLTAIHFHYSAFLLPVFVGFFGRLHESKWYKVCVPILLAGPLLVALGITFWPLLEVISVVLYIFALYTLIYLVFQTHFPSKIQAFCVRLSFFTLAITILFSLMYASNSAFGKWGISIDLMLLFHGLANCIFFGMFGVLGWVWLPPKTKQPVWEFPVSKIRGSFKSEGEKKSGLVKDLSEYVNTQRLPSSIIDFYEHTENYHLVAAVRWASWFKPFALFYKLISNKIQQINLPVSSKPVEMTGSIEAVDESLDGRPNPRVWKRNIGTNGVFKAIYSYHQTNNRTFMNIALPLPFSAMIGILQLDEKDGTLILSSKGEPDAGVYLAVGRFLFKLPLSEYFVIKESTNNTLTATHKMTIFGLPFLTISYEMSLKNVSGKTNIS